MIAEPSESSGGAGAGQTTSEPPVGGPRGGTPPQPAAQPAVPAARTVVAWSFAGGELAAAVQLGSIHAMIVSPAARMPDVVVGVSTGAVNAAAMAEVLQAGTTLHARKTRLRNFIDLYKSAPHQLIDAASPDLQELNADKPIEGVTLPMHSPHERASKHDALNSRYGLMRLINDILQLRISVSGLNALAVRWTRTRSDVWAWPGRFAAAVVMIWRLAPMGIPLCRGTTVKWRRGRDPALLRFRAGRALASLWRKFAGAWLLVVLCIKLCLLKVASKPVRPELKRIGRNLLKSYHLQSELGEVHVLRQIYAAFFDEHYYGAPDMNQIVHAAFDKPGRAARRRGKKEKRLSSYATGTRTPSLAIVPIVADLQTGCMAAVSPDVSVVDALVAATARTPWLGPQNVTVDLLNSAQAGAVPVNGIRRWCVDAASISNNALYATINVLRERDIQSATNIEVYSISGLPIPRKSLRASPDVSANPLDSSIKVMARGYELQRHADAELEEKIVNLFSHMIGGYPVVQVSGGRYLRVIAKHIRIAGLRRLKGGFWTAADTKRREWLLNGMAQSCAATRRAMDASESCPAGGLPEVCERCRKSRKAGGNGHAGNAPGVPAKAPGGAGIGGRFTKEDFDRPDRQQENQNCKPEDVTTTVLFSGGVFRGVFQVGVLNALRELDFHPKIIAGASVGSITGAMGARVLSDQSDASRMRMLQVACTFLTLDQLVLTDRLAELVQRLSYRAAATRLSLNGLDRVLRQYDQPKSLSSREWRRVVAGVERLIYISPDQLRKVVGAMHDGDYPRLRAELQRAAERFIRQYGIRDELMGPDMIEILLLGWVMDQSRFCSSAIAPRQRTFNDCFGADPLMLAAVTNLNIGEVEILNSGPNNAQPFLLGGLLASSAFPGVFRPRRAWEVFATPRPEQQDTLYADGGILNNLPLDAVTRYLYQHRRRRPIINGRPVPHLIIAGSLEVDPRELKNQDIERIARDWTLAFSRANQLAYNRKLDLFSGVQRSLRELWHLGLATMTPVDVEVLGIKPRWLCPTFGFHRLTGFDLVEQAASIAHGCAMTFIEVLRVGRQEPEWTHHWGLDRMQSCHDPDAERLLVQPSVPSQAEMSKWAGGKYCGECWFRRGETCPFSARGMDNLMPRVGANILSDRMKKELTKIYRECGKRETHQYR